MKSGVSRANLWLAVVAIGITFLVRFTIFTSDCNLVIMAMTFLTVYGFLAGISIIVRRFRRSDRT